MVAAGPRVGGAHVDVNLKFDDSSLDTLAKRIQSQLADIGRSNRKAYQSIGRAAVTSWRAALGSILAGAPLIGSAISAAAGSITVLAGSLYSLAQSSAGFIPIFTSLGTAGIVAGIGMRGFAAAVSQVDPKILALQLADMPKQMANAVLATRKLSKEMRAALFPKLFAGVADGIKSLSGTGVLTRGFGKMADSINGLVLSLLDYAGTKAGVSTLNRFFAGNAKVFAALSKAVVPFLDAFLRLTNALTPSAIRLSGHITDLAKYFQDLTKADGFGKRINDAMLKAEKTTGKLFRVLKNLGAAIANIFGAANPATNTFLNMLIRVTGRFKQFTGSVEGQQAIRDWAAKSVEVTKKFGETIRAVFDVIKKLTNSEVLISFLTTLEGAFKNISKLPLDKFVDAFVQIAKKLQPISSALLAVVIGGAAFNIFIGSLLGQLGGLFAVFGSFSKVKDIFGGIFGKGGGGKHIAEVGKFTGIFKALGGILGKALKFAGLAGLVAYIVILITKSKALQAKVKEAFQAFKDLAGPLKDAFTEIKTALDPIAKSLSPVFGFLDKIATLGIGLILDSIIYAFKSFGNVITGVGRIVAGAITFFRGLFTLDGSLMLDGLKKIASGILPLLKGLIGLFITFFAPAKFLKLGAFAFKALGRAIRGAFPAIRGAAGGILRGILQFLGQLPGRLIVLGRHAITKLSDAFRSGAPGVLQAILRIVGTVLKGIGTLPALLIKLGFRAIKSLAGSFRSGVSKIASAAGTLFKAIWNEIKGLPGDMLKLGASIIGGLVDGILGKLGDLKDAAGKIGGAIKDFLPGSPVREGPLVAWNHGAGATGGGRNVIDAITGGLRDTDPIRKAMADVASAVSSSLIPRVAVAGGGDVRRSADPQRASQDDSGGNVFISKMMPHNYGEFEKQMREKKRLAGLGGRRSVTA